MEFLSSDKIAVIDLSTGEVAEDELGEELVSQYIGGAAINAALYEKYQAEDPMVIGAGLFTGTLVPASSLSVITAKSPLTGKVCHAPITQYAGMEFKYSGFDYLVIKGVSAAPVFLWIHDGIADIESAADLAGKDIWQAVEAVRKTMGDDMIQILGAGPAAEKGSDLAQVMINQWASGDAWGFGKLMASKNLRLIAIRGMGLLEVAEDEEFVAECLDLLGAVKSGAWAGKQGLADLAAGLGYEDFGAWLEPVAHRSHASFNVPFAYNTFAFLEGDPAQKTEVDVDEPGVLLADPIAIGNLKKMGLGVAEACGIIKDCAKAGLDAAAVTKVCQSKGKTGAADIKASLEGISGPVEGLGGVFSPWAPRELAADEAAWQRRQAVAYVFGLDPIFMLMSPEITEKKLLELAAMGTELDINGDTLDKVVSGLLG